MQPKFIKYKKRVCSSKRAVRKSKRILPDHTWAYPFYQFHIRFKMDIIVIEFGWETEIFTEQWNVLLEAIGIRNGKGKFIGDGKTKNFKCN